MIRGSSYNLVLCNFKKRLTLERRNGKQTNSLYSNLKIFRTLKLLIPYLIIPQKNVIRPPFWKSDCCRHCPTLFLILFGHFPQINILLLYYEVFFPTIAEIHISSHKNIIHFSVYILDHFQLLYS